MLIAVLFLEAGAARSKKGAKSTMKREIDYVIINAKILKNNLKKDISNMGLFAFRNGNISPIPFQIDEMNPEGEYVLTQIPPGDLADEDLKPEQDVDNGLLDDNDQIVFMIKDSGDRISGKKDLPPNATSVDEITLVDPLNKGKSWVYLCSFKGNPDTSNIDYIKYQFPQNLLVSKNYVVGFDKEVPVFPGYLTIHGSENIVDRVKVRVNTKIFFIPYSVDEEDLVSKISLYKDGPVRVIRRTSTAIRFMGIFKTPYLAIEMVAYDKIAMIPIRMNVPFNIIDYKGVLSALLRAGVDFYNVRGWKMKTNVHSKWVDLDGKMSNMEKMMNGQDMNWFLLNGEGKAFLVRIIMNRKPDGSYQDTPITPHLYYMDNDKLEDPPENIPGQSPNVLYQLDGFENLKKGYLYFYTIFYIIDNYEDGMEKEYLRIIDKPIEAYSNR